MTTTVMRSRMGRMLCGVDAPRASASSDRMGRYELQEAVGHGGSATVYRALDPKHSRTVALKVIPFGGGEKSGRRFLREARVLASLKHPSLPRVYAVGRSKGRLYLSCEMLEGENLETALKSGNVSLERSVAAVRDVARALAYAHRRGVVHRDVKPANIILCADRNVLIDFGLAKRLSQESQQITRPGQLIGTLPYMAPEQLLPKKFGEVGAPTDIRALGATLFHCITGRAPFKARRDPCEVLLRIVQEDAPCVRDVAPDAPDALVELCRSAMARYPRRRIKAAELADALDAWLQDRAALAERSRAPTERNPVRRHRASRIGRRLRVVRGALAVATIAAACAIATYQAGPWGKTATSDPAAIATDDGSSPFRNAHSSP